ncbi:MAG TPA: type VI secretion system protein TssA, partial [Steroidobacteraceae bacterium]|nr:type VI secretion system protein TssA [Steroidobacteraceae bacterium]
TQLLASFDAYHLFGQTVQLPETDWRELKTASLEALAQSKDLRLLCHFAAAGLRTDGWTGFLGSLHVAAGWLKQHWEKVYPLVDEDAILRKNALSCFSDRIAVIDGVRRTPLIENKQLGRFTLRDIELATGKLTPTEADTTPPTESEVAAVLAAMPLEELQMIEASFATAVADVQAIDAAMREYGGAAASPDFDALSDTLGALRKVLREQLDSRGPATGEAAGGESADGGESGGTGKAVGGIKSRQDAIRAIDVVAAYFRQNEPSSPVPILLDRAKNLIGKSFLDILQDISPEGVASAKLAGGIKDE